MSFDLGLWYSSKPINDKEASLIYHNLCNGIHCELEPSERINSFISELTRKYSCIDNVAEEEIDDSPWSCALDISASHVILSIVWSRSEEMLQIVTKLAAKYGLLCFDPQSGSQCLYDETKFIKIKNQVSSAKKFSNEVMNFVNKELLALGMIKKGELFLIDLGEDIWGWLGLGEVRNDGFEISPTIGVRFELVEKTIDELRGKKIPSLHPTIGSNIGYLLPIFKGYYSWRFHQDKQYETKVKQMIWFISHFGFRFMHSIKDLKALSKSLRVHGSFEHNKYSLPVIFTLLGNYPKAEKTSQEYLKKLKLDKHPAFEEYKEFVDRLICKINK